MTLLNLLRSFHKRFSAANFQPSTPMFSSANIQIPQNLYEELTMKGLCSLECRILDNSSKEVQDQINKAFSSKQFAIYLKKAKKRKCNYYGETDKWLYQALEKYSIRNKDICIFGSANPWYEAVALEFGVKTCDVIEYSDRISFDPRINYIKPVNQYSKTYDIALSISSFEHDGLGRYGDPINPNGDLVAMHNAKKIIKPGGLLFLSVPVGKDKICFNVHRIYGKHRLPLMLKGWSVLECFGFTELDFDNTLNGPFGTPYQPVFVLKKGI